jgi:hypothetical protein
MVSDIEKSDPNACIVDFDSYPFSGFQVLAIGIPEVNNWDRVEGASLRLDVIVGRAIRHRDGQENGDRSREDTNFKIAGAPGKR